MFEREFSGNILLFYFRNLNKYLEGGIEIMGYRRRFWFLRSRKNVKGRVWIVIIRRVIKIFFCVFFKEFGWKGNERWRVF